MRDGFHLEYFGVMLEDATHHLGPDFIQAASVYNVEKFFGWVSTVADFCGTFGQIPHDQEISECPSSRSTRRNSRPRSRLIRRAPRRANTVYVSGTLALGPGGTVLHPATLRRRPGTCWRRSGSLWRRPARRMADVAFNHIFLTDWADYPAMNQVYAEYFPGAKPARYCIQCGLVKPGLLVEIASVAHLG